MLGRWSVARWSIVHDYPQLVEHCTGITKVLGLKPTEASELFLGFHCNCFSCFITVRITFTSILYLQLSAHMIYMCNVYHTHISLTFI